MGTANRRVLKGIPTAIRSAFIAYGDTKQFLTLSLAQAKTIVDVFGDVPDMVTIHICARNSNQSSLTMNARTSYVRSHCIAFCQRASG